MFAPTILDSHFKIDGPFCLLGYDENMSSNHYRFIDKFCSLLYEMYNKYNRMNSMGEQLI